MRKKIEKLLYILKIGSFTECAKCDRFHECDRKPYIHLVEDTCNYGRIHDRNIVLYGQNKNAMP